MKHQRHTHLNLLLTLFILLFGNWAIAGSPAIVVTVKPIHSLVAGITKGVTEPQLLIKGGQSPHTFSLRPSDARKLSSAQLVVWVGEELETPLHDKLPVLAKKAHILSLMESDDESSGEHTDAHKDEHDHHDNHSAKAEEEHNHDDHNDHAAEREEDHDHDEHAHHHSKDPHIWLSPIIAQSIVNKVLAELIELDPKHGREYRENASKTIDRLKQLDQSIAQRTSEIKQVPFIVFHDAYSHFEEHYQLNHAGAITVSPERQPGAKRIAELRKTIVASGARCIFAEPQFPPKLAHMLAMNTQARVGLLDPVGSQLAEGSEAYFQLMNGLTDNLVKCLR